MPRYIDADALKLPSELPVDPYDDPYFRWMYSGRNNAIRECKDLIDSAPTISPDEIRGVGKWLNDVGEFGFPEIPCSVCGYKSGHYGFKYCPSCGAKMEVSEDA